MPIWNGNCSRCSSRLPRRLVFEEPFDLAEGIADPGLIRGLSGLGRGIGKYEVMRGEFATFVRQPGTGRPVAGPQP